MDLYALFHSRALQLNSPSREFIIRYLQATPLLRSTPIHSWSLFHYLRPPPAAAYQVVIEESSSIMTLKLVPYRIPDVHETPQNPCSESVVSFRMFADFPLCPDNVVELLPLIASQFPFYYCAGSQHFTCVEYSLYLAKTLQATWAFLAVFTNEFITDQRTHLKK